MNLLIRQRAETFSRSASVALRSAWTHTQAFFVRNKRFARRYHDLAMVLVGFLLATGWEELKARRAEQIELARAIRSVDQEAELDLAIIAQNKALLEQDTIAADDHKEIVLPLDHLLAGAIDAAVLRGSFDTKSLDLSARARNAGAGILLANRWIEERELYRATNQAFSNYEQRRKMINANIKARLEQLEAALYELRAELAKP